MEIMVAMILLRKLQCCNVESVAKARFVSSAVADYGIASSTQGVEGSG